MMIRCIALRKERQREPGRLRDATQRQTDRRRRGRHFAAKDLEREREKEGGAEK